MWLKSHFEEYTKHLIGTRLLIIDGHGSHVNLETIDLARDLGIELFCLPPHTTQILQPLDVSLYGPLKTYFTKITDKIQIIKLGVTKNVTICKTEFSAVFDLAMQETFSPSKCMKAFESCGIYPLNPFRIDTKRLMPTDLQPTAATTIAAVTTPVSTATTTTAATTPVSTATTIAAVLFQIYEY